MFAAAFATITAFQVVLFGKDQIPFRAFVKITGFQRGFAPFVGRRTAHGSKVLIAPQVFPEIQFSKHEKRGIWAPFPAVRCSRLAQAGWPWACVGSQGRLRGLGPAAGRSAPPAAAIRGALVACTDLQYLKQLN